jgi:hypothetical protein
MIFEASVSTLHRVAAAVMIAGSLLSSGCERKVVGEPAIRERVEPEKPLEPWESVDDAFKGCELG